MCTTDAYNNAMYTAKPYLCSHLQLFCMTVFPSYGYSGIDH